MRAKAFAWVAAARTKQPDASYVRYDADAITTDTLTEIVGTQGLFYTKTLALLDDPFSKKEAGEAVLSHLAMLTESPNPIAILAPKLLATHKKKLEGSAEKVFAIDLAEPKEARGFNNALVGAFQEKNTLLLWKELMKAFRAGDAPEAVHGLLHWKARDMMRKGNKVWGREGARAVSVELIQLLSDSRGGELALKESLERWALSIR